MKFFVVGTGVKPNIDSNKTTLIRLDALIKNLKLLILEPKKPIVQVK